MLLVKDDIKRFLVKKDLLKLVKSVDNIPEASWLFVTRNRCPFPNPQKNPLVWAFQTLLNNKYYKIKEFVVVDDFSNDFTRESVDWLSRKYNINIKYIKNKKRLSCSASRQVGLLQTTNELVFMGDDDCLYSEFFLIGSILTYKILSTLRANEKIAVLNLPVYEKDLLPKHSVSLNKIGKVEINNTFFYHEFEKFPAEYLFRPKYLDKLNVLLKPIEIDTFKGVNLCNKDMIIKSGGYLDLSMWASSYSEHIELSYKLQKFGYKMYHQPDPKISCLHFKYGNLSKDKFDKRLYNKKMTGLKYTLGQMVDMAQKTNLDTGGRLNEYEFHIIEIGSFFSFYLKISNQLGFKFVKDQYKRFIEDALVFSTTPSEKIKQKEKRKELFFKAIDLGVKATEIQTEKKYNNFKKEMNIFKSKLM